MKNFAGARQDFEVARQIAPGDPTPNNNLALVAMQENKPEEAIASFENALRVDATNFVALNGIITQYASSKELPKAHSRIDQALSAYPNVAWLHFLKGQVYGYEGNGTAAEASTIRLRRRRSSRGRRPTPSPPTSMRFQAIPPGCRT